MHATYAKTQKIEPGPFFFNDGRKFQRQSVNMIETQCEVVFIFQQAKNLNSVCDVPVAQW